MDSTTRRVIDGLHVGILLGYNRARAVDVASTKEYMHNLFNIELKRFASLWVAYGPRSGQFVVGFVTDGTCEHLGGKNGGKIGPSFVAVNWEDDSVGKPWIGTLVNGSVLHVELTSNGLVDSPPAHEERTMSINNDVDTLIAAGFDMEYDRRDKYEQLDQLTTARKKSFMSVR